MLRTEHRRAPRGVPYVAVLLTGLLALAGSPASAQQDAPDDDAAAQEVAPPDSLVQGEDVDYRREVYDYPRRDRNPFEPVRAGVQEGPRFQNLELAGVIYSPSIGSVAVLQDRSTGERFRIREGERIGQATVLQIRRTNVMFSVAGPTQSRQETLQVEKQNEEVQR